MIVVTNVVVIMVVSLAAYVHASIRTERHEFDGGFALLLFLADSFTAAAFVPDLPFAM